MREFALLLKVLLKNASRAGSKKGSKNLAAVLTTLPFSILISFAVGFITVSSVRDMNSLFLLLTLVYSFSQFFLLFVLLNSVLNTLYGADDVPFLNTLPLRSGVAFFAKFAAVYIRFLLLSAEIVLPVMLTATIAYAIKWGAMFWGFFALVFALILLLPLLPLFVISAFSMPLSYLGSFFKGHAVLKSILSISFYALFMALYFVFIGKVSMYDLGTVSGKSLKALEIVSLVFYPNRSLVGLSLGIEPLKNFLVALGSTLFFAGAIALFAKLFFKRITQRKLETVATVRQRANFSEQNLFFSLVKKDFKCIIREPQLALGSFSNAVLMPVILVMMYFTVLKGFNADEGMRDILEFMKLGFVDMYAIIFMAGANTLAISAFTREGKSFYLTKSLPISGKDMILAKLAFASSVPILFFPISLVIAIFLYKINALVVLAFTACTLPMIFGVNALQIYFDLRYGNVNWKNRQEMNSASGGGVKGALYGALLATAIAVGEFLALIVLMPPLTRTIGAVGAYAVFFAICLALSLVSLATGLYLLFTRGEQYFCSLADRQFLSKGSAKNLLKARIK